MCVHVCACVCMCVHAWMQNIQMRVAHVFAKIHELASGSVTKWRKVSEAHHPHGGGVPTAVEGDGDGGGIFQHNSGNKPPLFNVEPTVEGRIIVIEKKKE